MSPLARRALVALAVVVVAATLALPGSAFAHEPSGSTTTVGVPAQDIVPEPDSGAAPSEAGDRGGALQLGVLGLVVMAMAGGVLFLVRQSRHARAIGDR